MDVFQDEESEFHVCKAISSIDKLSFIQSQHAVGPRGGTRVVRDQNDRFVQTAPQLFQQVQNLLGAFGVEIAGRLIGHDQLRIGHDRAGDAHALLLATGKLTRPVPTAVLEANQIEGDFHLLAASSSPRAATTTAAARHFQRR